MSMCVVTGLIVSQSSAHLGLDSLISHPFLFYRGKAYNLARK
jgi:hypothetical protein